MLVVDIHQHAAHSAAMQEGRLGRRDAGSNRSTRRLVPSELHRCERDVVLAAANAASAATTVASALASCRAFATAATAMATGVAATTVVTIVTGAAAVRVHAVWRGILSWR